MFDRWIPAAVLFLIVVCFSCSSSDPLDPEPQATFTFLVTVPGTTPATDVIYLTGDFQGWDPGDPGFALSRRPDGLWEIQPTLDEGQILEFKFTRGSWATIEKGAAGDEIPNRTAFTVDGQAYEAEVARWADS